MDTSVFVWENENLSDTHSMRTNTHGKLILQHAFEFDLHIMNAIFKKRKTLDIHLRFKREKVTN